MVADERRLSTKEVRTRLDFGPTKHSSSYEGLQIYDDGIPWVFVDLNLLTLAMASPRNESGMLPG